jgi:hypothetical protein
VFSIGNVWCLVVVGGHGGGMTGLVFFYLIFGSLD